MANESLVSSIAADLRPDVVEDAYFVAEEENLMSNLVRIFNDQSGMQDRNLGVYPQFTASTVTENNEIGTNSEFTKTVKATVTPIITQVEAVLTDERALSDLQNARADLGMNIGRALSRKLDEDLCAEFASFTVSKGNGGSAVTIDSTAAAISVLRNGNTPNQLAAVWHPYHWHDLWVELARPAANYAFLGDTANRALMDYFVSDWMNVAHFSNSNIAAQSGTVYSGVFHRDAIALDSRTPIELELQREAKFRRTIFVAHQRYGTTVYKSEHGASIAGDVTEPS